MPVKGSLVKTAIGFLGLTTSVFANPITSAVAAEGSILDRALYVLGGEQALSDLKGVTYHAPK